MKSHQDDDMPSDSLSSPAQANVSADSLVTHARSHTRCNPVCEVFDASMCQLLIGSWSITNRIHSQIRHFAFDLPFHEFVLQSRPWSFCDDIDWEPLGSHLSSNPNHLHFLFKLAHHLLPTGKTLHRRNPLESPYCPACGDIESNEHFLCCSHPSQLHLHLQLVVQVRCALDKVRSDPILKDIMLEGIDSFVLNHEFPFACYPAQYQGLCRSQDALGWINLVHGSVSVHWRSIQDNYYHRNAMADSCGRHGVLCVLRCVHDSLHELWVFLNSQRHGKDMQSQVSKIRQQTIQHLTELYQF